MIYDFWKIFAFSMKKGLKCMEPISPLKHDLGLNDLGFRIGRLSQRPSAAYPGALTPAEGARAVYLYCTLDSPSFRSIARESSEHLKGKILATRP
jgi:hypothetical protein